MFEMIAATVPRGSMDLSGWLILGCLLCCASCQTVSPSFDHKTGQNESKPRVFSPRMDYDEWTPLGRGDPLKNNPTFDYVPPVLDRVQYWLDSHTTEASAKRDILVLGVTAKKTSPKIPEQFLKFVDGPKFSRTQATQDGSYRNDFTGSTGAEPPKVVRTGNFRNGGPADYRNQNRIQSIPASYYPSPYYNSQKAKPYTMMLPPPLVQKPDHPSSAPFNGSPGKEKAPGYVDASTQQFSTQTEEGPVIQSSQFYAIPSKGYQHVQSQPPPVRQHTPVKSNGSKGQVVSQIETIKSAHASSPPLPTKSRYEATTVPSSVSFEKSNLIYQSTQTLSGGWPAGNGVTSTSSATVTDASQATWQTADYARDQYELDHHVAASSNHEVVIGQNANIIVEGDTGENEEVVVGQKEILSPDRPSPTSVNVVQPSTIITTSTKEDEQEEEGTPGQKMHIVVANSPSGLDIETHEAKKGPVAVVMPTNYVEKKPNQTVHSFETPSPTMEDTSTTPDLEKSSQRVSQGQTQPQPTRTSATSPVFLEESQSSMPNRMMMPSHHQGPPPTPMRHVPGPQHMFGVPQAPPLQPMTHVQPPRPNHGMMHFIGSMRPGNGFRAPGSMSMFHVFPPMAHMHAPPPKSPPPHTQTTMDHQRPPQTIANAFTGSSSPSTLTVGGEDHSFEHHRTPGPEATSQTTTPIPFLPTLSTTGGSQPGESTEDRVNQGQSSLVKILNKEETRNQEQDHQEQEKKKSSTNESSNDHPMTTTDSPQMTTVPSLTTDPIFSHYKQPAKPIRGPMYLIIQGHSKVKTYKPTVSKHGPPLERNEIEGVTERQLSKFEQFIKENTKSRVDPEKRKLEEKARAEKLSQPRPSQDSLMSLIESGIGSFTLSPGSSAATLEDENEHHGNSVTTVQATKAN